MTMSTRFKRMWRASSPMAVLLAAACGGCDSSTPTPSPTPTPTPTPPANRAPTFTSAATASVTENSDVTTIAYQASATDPEGSAVTYTLSGADAALFGMNTSGAVRFLASPNFEFPKDANQDNSYELQITASDGQLSAALAVTVKVTNNIEGIKTSYIGSLDQDIARTSYKDAVSFFTPPPDLAIDTGGYVYVAQRTGVVGMLSSFNNNLARRFQISDVATDGERGLVSITPTPGYQVVGTPGYFLAMYSDTGGNIVIRRFRRFEQIGFGAQTGTLILSIPHSQNSNNVNGWLGYGPDGNIYVATGDGGGSGDPLGTAQDSGSLLGKVLRISPDFATVTVVAKGFRNPSGGAFYNNMLVLGDRGETKDEINLIPLTGAVGNYGWPYKEGSTVVRAGAPAGLVEPVAECPHGDGTRNCFNLTVGAVISPTGVTPWRNKLILFDRSRAARQGAIFAIPTSRLVLDQPVIQSNEFEWLTGDVVDPTTASVFDPSAMGFFSSSFTVANAASGHLWSYSYTAP